jgi:UDP-N-acetylglucosamine 4,6-dehydratase/5-epimerase
MHRNFFLGKSILITGGTGSFGQAFTKVILRNYKPKRLIIFSRGEAKQLEMASTFSQDKYKCLRYFIGDVRDLERLKIAMRNVDYVVHAAAMKQVPASEYNPIECIKTNITGAQNIIISSIENRVKKVLALSTDKAVSPINLYGATKLVSDKLFISANNLSGNQGPIFSIVRYGNVYGSTGSVVQIFKKIMNTKKPFPITDANMTRFFLTLEDGINFVIESFSKMIGGEIFIPKIFSIKITDLARCLDPNRSLDIIGLRPGEKIHEVMTSKDDNRSLIEFKNYYNLASSSVYKNLNKFLVNKNREKGKFVNENFEFSSEKNKFLNDKEIKKMIKSDMKF